MNNNNEKETLTTNLTKLSIGSINEIVYNESQKQKSNNNNLDSIASLLFLCVKDVTQKRNILNDMTNATEEISGTQKNTITKNS